MARSPLPIIVAGALCFLALCTLNILNKLDLGPDVAYIWNTESWKYATSFWQDRKHGDEYLLGVGKGDITGPVAEINFMGYADPAQLGTGLRQRLYSRAFIVGDIEEAKDRFVYLVLDTQSGDTAVRHGILEALSQMGDEYALYGQHNVAVTGTHSHSGPGAWLNYLLPQITSKGFNKPSYQAVVDGAVASIRQAHERRAPGHLSVGNIDILDANINRSPWAYLQNPSDERSRYEHDVDKTLTALRFTRTGSSGEEDIGVLTWFAVHGTSMHGNNTLVTGDNKGVAAVLFEKSTGESSFVAGFSQANVGDTSPNVLGAFCESGEQAGEGCDFKTSLCGNKTQPCHARGPFFGRNDAGTASNYEIGSRQFEGARKLFDDQAAFTPVRGKVVRSFHQFVDMSNHHFSLPNGTHVSTCPAAMGFSFAAGTSDGPGAFDFKQGQPGDPHANPLWKLVGNRIAKANDTQKACHREKPILLDVGESSTPYDWTPNIVDLQVLRVGQMFIIVSPGEATTMAGRRWREAVGASAVSTFDDVDAGGSKPIVVLGGPANTYTHYITTPEEYSVQRYEGASTLYGPWTLDAYINLTLKYLPRLSTSSKDWPHFPTGPNPPIHTNKSLSFITPVVVDRAGFFKNFGDVITNVDEVPYHAGDTISARFIGANPRNDFRLGKTFAAVEKENEDSASWEQVCSDEDWSLVYEWKRTSTTLGTSEVTISWETKWETGAWRGDDSEDSSGVHTDLLVRDSPLKGRYRLRYYGDYKSLGGGITPFEGTSGVFTIE
ncbi:Neutral ceramidase 2 [Fulvia fulva]|uniref:Neutral ceramidase n=1 Tax=Passalora fulva TaxID=5499 RepID=A0A9Q8PHY0_PASFU|nr:Neutral ceramidase 2 [Fulvia fulva]KAK4626303.1 Neutral ceramidase 2 [Fulvia fulva]KAK4628473.1 Neutral ceramidase 2 [Fulvia fulva]UJO22798.1 Neutral ceramidase 2 [Fulvia fulva]WPV13839.1 Neutral ceramidase 2 [Fulvia fulva]WPV28198.1 Neutral ceramidase 2 [Fulvia fulva]